MSIAQSIRLPQVSGEISSPATAALRSVWKTSMSLAWALLVDIGRRRGELALKHGHY